MKKTQAWQFLPVYLFVIIDCILFLNSVLAFYVILSYLVGLLSTMSMEPQKWIHPFAVKDLVNSITP